MEKSDIKNKLRESLARFIYEEENNDVDKESTPSAEYAEIVNAFKGLGKPAQADIMQLAGLGKKDDKTAESLFSKKLNKKEEQRNW